MIIWMKIGKIYQKKKNYTIFNIFIVVCVVQNFLLMIINMQKKFINYLIVKK